MISDEPEDSEILTTLKRLDAVGAESSTGGLFADAAKCIRWLQAGLAASDLDCESKRGALEVLTEGRGLPDDDLWSALKGERDKFKALNEDKFRTIQAYCKAASEDKATINRLRYACGSALVELMWLADQVKARKGGSVDRAIQSCKNALACPECGGSGSVVKAGPLAAGINDTYQEPCEACDGGRKVDAHPPTHSPGKAGK